MSPIAYRIGRCGASALACLALAGICAQPAQAAPDAEVLQALSQVYSTALISRAVADFCAAEAPPNAAQAASAYQAWRQRNETDELIRDFEAALPASQLQGLQRTGNTVKDKLRQSGSPSQGCAGFINAWGGADMDMRRKYPRAYGTDGHIVSFQDRMQRLKADQGLARETTSKDASREALGPSRQPIRPEGTSYSVAQIIELNSLWWQNAGSYDEAQRRARGAGRIYVRGEAIHYTSGWRLIQRDDAFVSRLTVIPGIDLSRYEAQVITVGGVPRETPKFFLYLDKAEVVQDASGLRPSTLPEASGLVRMKVAAKRIRTAPGQGIAPKDIVAVTHHGHMEAGVGDGMDFIDDVHVLLRDGTAYDRAEVPPADLDVKASKALEPQHWSRWEAAGQGRYRLLKQDDRGRPAAKWTPIQDHAIRAWRPDERLNDSFETRRFSGSVATGGASSRTVVSFKPDGRFEIVGSVLITSGAALANDGDSVSSSGHSDGKGTTSTTSANGGGAGVHAQGRRNDGDEHRGSYRLDGYTAELRFDSGRVARLFSFAWNDKLDCVYILGESYVSVRRNK